MRGTMADQGAQSSQGNSPSGTESPGSVAGRHPEPTVLPVLVAPTRGGAVNTLGLTLAPLACWRLEDLHFDFGSSFVKPEVKSEFPLLAKLLEETNGPALSVFGHADPVGRDVYNKTLSNRRAIAIYATLVRDEKLWEKLFSRPFGDDIWGTKSLQLMLAALEFDPGSPDGVMGPATRRAVQAFQSEAGSSGDAKGEAGKGTRAKIFLAYMDLICRDAKDKPFQVKKEDFLGGGKDPEGRGDFQGCGEFNPVLVFSKEEDKKLADPKLKLQRDGENVPNRRVLIFLFPPGLRVAPEVWPCPHVGPVDQEDAKGAAVCRSRFWPDGDERRSPQDKRREYKDSNTVACAFYDAMARRSPCEVGRITLRLRLLDSMRNPIEFAPYRVKVGSQFKRLGTANDQGRLEEAGIPAPSRCDVEWGYPGLSDPPEKGGEPNFSFQRTLELDFDQGAREEQARVRLLNLGYPAENELVENLEAFQRDYNLDPPDGELNAATETALQQVHDAGLTREELGQ
jgi:outer membrane protein OmpA-like peptidoglycan-associated protein